jgi:hypothetical protein
MISVVSVCSSLVNSLLRALRWASGRIGRIPHKEASCSGLGVYDNDNTMTMAVTPLASENEG